MFWKLFTRSIGPVKPSDHNLHAGKAVPALVGAMLIQLLCPLQGGALPRDLLLEPEPGVDGSSSVFLRPDSLSLLSSRAARPEEPDSLVSTWELIRTDPKSDGDREGAPGGGALPRKPGEKLSPFVLTASLFLMSYRLDREAGVSYERYERTADPAKMELYYSRGRRWHRWSNGFLFGAEAALVYSLFHAFGEPDPDDPGSAVKLEFLDRGRTLGFCLDIARITGMIRRGSGE